MPEGPAEVVEPVGLAVGRMANLSPTKTKGRSPGRSMTHWLCHRDRQRQAARYPANARAAIASTGFVVTANATTNAWRVAPRKKAAASMESADPSPTIPTRTTIAPWARVTGKTCARTTMVWLVRHHRNVCPTIASTGFAAETSAWAHARRVRLRKKVAVPTAFAA